MNDISKLSDTIKPKSDQLNADDLLANAITVEITAVERGWYVVHVQSGWEDKVRTNLEERIRLRAQHAGANDEHLVWRRDGGDRIGQQCQRNITASEALGHDA